MSNACCIEVCLRGFVTRMNFTSERSSFTALEIYPKELLSTSITVAFLNNSPTLLLEVFLLYFYSIVFLIHVGKGKKLVLYCGQSMDKDKIKSDN